MRAVVVGPGGPALADDVPVPVPGEHEVLVRVRACGLNRADLGMAAGLRHGAAGGAGAVLGLEWAGEVVRTGAAVKGLREGDRVMGSGGSAFAEYAVSDHGRVMPIPSAGMGFEQAAGLPVALQTMHDAVITHGQLAPGGTVLIKGASSGVGLMALQIARWRGATLVAGTSTDPGRRARLADFGAQLALDSTDPGWVAQLLEATGGRGVDLVVDQVSGALATPNLHATRILGRIVNVGRLGGMRAEFDFDLHALRRITYVGVTFRTRSVAEVREINRRMIADLAEPLASGAIGLPVDSVFPLDQAPQALAHLRANRHFGKVILRT
jgi:NADPH2:quinone reductase